MRIRNALLAAAALTGVIAAAAPAAAITYSVGAANDMSLPSGQSVIYDFEPGETIAAGFTFTGGYTRDGALGLDPSVSAPPPADTTWYETVLGGQTATLTSAQGLKSFSFYLGSPDSYNTVKLYSSSGLIANLSGSAIWNGVGGDNGDQGWGRRINYTFGDSERVTKIEFISSGNSFEFDSLAGAVPEPATWAMMIMGFGLVGVTVRRRRVAATFA